MTDLDREIAELKAREAAAEALWAAGPRKFITDGSADFVERNDSFATTYPNQKLPLSFGSKKDDRPWKPGRLHGQDVRDHGDGTYSTLKQGVRIFHSKEARARHMELVGAHKGEQ